VFCLGLTSSTISMLVDVCDEPLIHESDCWEPNPVSWLDSLHDLILANDRTAKRRVSRSQSHKTSRAVGWVVG